MKVFKVKFVLLILLLLSCTLITEAAGVRPLVLDLKVLPGDVRDFQINIIPGETEEVVDLTLFEAIQQRSGSLIYSQPSNPSFSVVSWVELEEDSIKTTLSEETVVRGRLRVPFSASGSHTVIVMVEPRPPAQTAGVGFQIRYAVRLNIQVEKAGLRPSGEVTDFKIKASEEGTPLIVASFKNNSQLDYFVTSEVSIRDKNRRLLEKVVLKPPALNADSRVRVYPGAEVDFLGEIKGPLPAGAYYLQLFFRYGESGQILLNKEFAIAEGQFKFPGFTEGEAMLVTPEKVEHKLKPGERKTQVFQFESMIEEKSRVEIAFKDIFSDYENSLVEWLELRSAKEFSLPPRAKTRLAITIAAPRDLEAGSYHGLVRFRTFLEETDELLTEKIIRLEVRVGEVEAHPLKITDTSTLALETGSLISLLVANLSNEAFLPKISATLLDETGQEVEKLEFQFSQAQLLPGEIAQATSLVSDLEAGNYQLQLELLTPTDQSRVEVNLVID